MGPAAEEVVDPGHIDEAGAGLREQVLALLRVPLVKTGRGDHAAAFRQTVGEERFFSRRLDPRVDHQRAVSFKAPLRRTLL